MKNGPNVYACLNRKYSPLLQREGIYGLKHPKEMSREGYLFFIHGQWTISKLENMLYYQIKNYEDFKKRFGLTTRENGVISRKNKILLGHLKNPLLLRYCLKHNDYSLLHISDMADLQKKVTEAVKESGRNDGKLTNKVELIGETYHSGLYRTNESKGICEDMDKSSVCYINVERNRTFKMKSGKFMRTLILETEIGKLLSPGILNWLSGDVFTRQWYTYAYGHGSGLKLHVDNRFDKIYDYWKCKGDFGSCMTGRNRDEFYAYSVNAKAAYITDEHDYIVARAILFTDVTDQHGKKWRLLERQYASNKDDTLKRLLIDKLIHGEYIDGYKVIGASCSDADAFVDISGNSLKNKKFEIDCRLDIRDTLSYQDSFKWYNHSKKKPIIMNRKNILTTLTPQTSTSMGMRTGMNGMTIMDIIVKKPGCATGTVRKSMWIRTT